MLNACGVNVWQPELYTAESLVPEPSLFEVEVAIQKLKRCKSLGFDQILAELIQAGGNRSCTYIHELTSCVWNREELPDQWEESVVIPVYKNDEKT
jgi:hypothetical protein